MRCPICDKYCEDVDADMQWNPFFHEHDCNECANEIQALTGNNWSTVDPTDPETFGGAGEFEMLEEEEDAFQTLHPEA